MSMKSLWEQAYGLADELEDLRERTKAALCFKDLEGVRNDLKANLEQFTLLVDLIEDAEKDARVSCLMGAREDWRRVSEIFC